MGIQVHRSKDESGNWKASLDYLARDYQRIKDDLIERIDEVLPEWKDRTEADLGIALIELYAAMGDVLSWYQDRIARESFLHTAEDLRSVIGHLRLIGYELKAAQPARVGLQLLYHRDEGIDQVTVQKGDRFSCADPKTEFEYVEDLPIILALAEGEAVIAYRSGHELFRAGKNSQLSYELKDEGILLDGSSGFELAVADELWTEVEDFGASVAEDRHYRITQAGGITTVHFSAASARPVENEIVKGFYAYDTGYVATAKFFVTEGRTWEQSDFAASDGQPAQALELKQLKALPDTVRLFVDGEEWTRVSDFAGSEYADQVFTVELDADERATIRLGDGVHGRIPNLGALYRVEYRAGGGVAGNLPAGSVTKVESAADPEVASRKAATILQDEAGGGGADRETAEEARIVAPARFRSQERAVTAFDFRALLESEFRGAKVKAEHTSLNRVAIYFAPAGGSEPSAETLEDYAVQIQTFLHDRRVVGTELDVRAAEYVKVHFAALVTVDHRHFREDVRYQVEQAVAGLLDFDILDFNAKLYLSRFYERIEAIDGVEAVLIHMLVREAGLGAAESGAKVTDAEWGSLQSALDAVDGDSDNLTGDLTAAVAGKAAQILPAAGCLRVTRQELFIPGTAYVFAQGGY